LARIPVKWWCWSLVGVYVGVFVAIGVYHYFGGIQPMHARTPGDFFKAWAMALPLGACNENLFVVNVY
jgi:hypothetical protein